MKGLWARWNDTTKPGQLQNVWISITDATYCSRNRN
jgi:hypothetical protein